ncbi:MAG: DUF1653 domain-containing protein [Candidatus Paceibacterota bacterium]
MKELEIGEVYKHYKGTKAKVLCEVFHSETMEKMVVYIHLEDGFIWARPKDMFLGNVIIDGIEQERFQKIDQEILIKSSKN